MNSIRVREKERDGCRGTAKKIRSESKKLLRLFHPYSPVHVELQSPSAAPLGGLLSLVGVLEELFSSLASLLVCTPQLEGFLCAEHDFFILPVK